MFITTGITTVTTGYYYYYYSNTFNTILITTTTTITGVTTEIVTGEEVETSVGLLLLRRNPERKFAEKICPSSSSRVVVAANATTGIGCKFFGKKSLNFYNECKSNLLLAQSAQPNKSSVPTWEFLHPHQQQPEVVADPFPPPHPRKFVV